jgi:hypothetical protein
MEAPVKSVFVALWVDAPRSWTPIVLRGGRLLASTHLPIGYYGGSIEQLYIPDINALLGHGSFISCSG